MSYDIIYGKQFIKLRKTGEVIPMILAGSNNCYEIGRGGRNGRRVRSWDSFRYYNGKGKFSEKPETILRKVDTELNKCIRQHRGDKEVTPTDIRNRYGWYMAIVVGSGSCGGTSWAKFRSLFSGGIKNSRTIEELDNLGVNLVFSPGYNSETGYPSSIGIKTEKAYFTERKKWLEWKGNNGRSFHLTFSPSDTDTVLRRLRVANRKEPREKTVVEQDHSFVLTNGHNNLIKYTSRGYRYSYSDTGGKKFMTEEAAEKYRKMLVDKGRYNADTWSVKRVDSSYSFLV